MRTTDPLKYLSQNSEQGGKLKKKKKKICKGVKILELIQSISTHNSQQNHMSPDCNVVIMCDDDDKWTSIYTSKTPE